MTAVVHTKPTVPMPRLPVANPKLTRPDWTAGTPRDPRKLWLDKNENGDPEFARFVNRVVREVIGALAPEALYTYPEVTPLYRKLAAHLGVEAANLLLAAGSDGVIRSVFEAFVAEGDRVVITHPTFAMYAVYAMMYGAEVTALEYERSSRGPLLRAEQFAEGIRRVQPRLVCLPNPDSPSGTVFVPAELRSIIEAAGDAGAVMLVDEAYYPFYEETVVPWVREYPHLVVARTFAKAWGLAGLRIGHAVASPEITRILHKVRPMYEVNTVAVAVMERMLDYRDQVEKSVKRLNDGRDSFVGEMEALGLPTIRCQGNFLHVAFGEHAAAVHAALEPMVLYRRDSADASLKGYSRFSATTGDLFKPVVDRIREVIRA
jgi:histidinol-phosphate aminotransferase